MRILLIRHGEPDYATDSLTQKGRREAELLARRMRSYHLRDIYVSPLGRARETAQCTLDILHREAEVLPWLAEFRGSYMDHAAGHRRIPWDFMPRFWHADPGLFDPETWCDVPLFAEGNVREIWEETVQGVDALMARYGFRKDGPVWKAEGNFRDTIALFCHFGISMAVLAYLQHLSPVPLWQCNLTLTSSLSEIVTEERVSGEVFFRTVRLGDISHLEAAGERRSTAGLFPEVWTGVDSTDPRVNHQPPWEL